MINRKRIRRLQEPIAALVERQTMLRNGSHGAVFNETSHHSCYLRGTDGMVMEVGRVFFGQLTMANEGRLLHNQCRALHIRALPLMPHYQHRRIGISTVKPTTQAFISGINFFQQQEAGLVGYHMPASEKWVEIPCNSRLEFIRVAFCSEGLTGIQFIFENSHTSGWVGDYSGPGIAQGTLSIDKSTDRPLLVAYLDSFKIVGICIGKLTCSTVVPSGRLTRMPNPATLQSPLQAFLWIPHSPSEQEVHISNFFPHQLMRTFDPVTNVDFGGPGGRSLGALTRLTFYMESTPDPLTGIELFYADSSPLLVGSRDGCEISCLVNGPKGERLAHIGVFEENESNGSGTRLKGLQVTLNMVLFFSWS